MKTLLSLFLISNMALSIFPHGIGSFRPLSKEEEKARCENENVLFERIKNIIPKPTGEATDELEHKDKTELKLAYDILIDHAVLTSTVRKTKLCYFNNLIFLVITTFLTY